MINLDDERTLQQLYRVTMPKTDLTSDSSRSFRAVSFYLKIDLQNLFQKILKMGFRAYFGGNPTANTLNVLETVNIETEFKLFIWPTFCRVTLPQH